MTISDERVTQFHAGQVWISPRGTYYRVEGVERGGWAKLRTGAFGEGRIKRKGWDDTGNGWVLVGDPTAPESYPVGQGERDSA